MGEWLQEHPPEQVPDAEEEEDHDRDDGGDEAHHREQFGAGAAVMVEFVDNRLKTADDVKRVTRLPVIAMIAFFWSFTAELQARASDLA